MNKRLTMDELRAAIAARLPDGWQVDVGQSGLPYREQEVFWIGAAAVRPDGRRFGSRTGYGAPQANDALAEGLAKALLRQSDEAEQSA